MYRFTGVVGVTPPAECQNPPSWTAWSDRFWADHNRADVCDKAFRRIVDTTGHGIRFPTLVEELYGREAIDKANYDYKHLRDFVFELDRDGFVDVERVGPQERPRDRLILVSPTIKGRRLASLDTASKHSVGTQDGDGVAKSNACGFLSRRRTIDDDAVRGGLLGAFAAKREATDDRFNCFEDTFTGAYSFIPYRTRFNSTSRVADNRDRLGTAFSRAAELGHDVGAVVTLTTDPGRFSDLEAACDTLLDDVNELKGWLGYQPTSGPSRVGHRAPSIVVPEFTDRGVPHVHLVLFGVGWVAKHSELSRYWGRNRDRGEVVWIDRIHRHRGQWDWGRSQANCAHEGARGRTPREYLSEGVNALATSAAHEAEEIQSVATDLREGEDPTSEQTATQLVEAALYWATGLPVVTCSPELKAPCDDEVGRACAPDGTPIPRDAPPRWRYVGTAQLDEFPAKIHERAVTRGRPPPDPPPRDDRGSMAA